VITREQRGSRDDLERRGVSNPAALPFSYLPPSREASCNNSRGEGGGVGNAKTVQVNGSESGIPSEFILRRRQTDSRDLRQVADLCCSNFSVGAVAWTNREPKEGW